MTNTEVPREVGEKIILVTPSGQNVVVTILQDNRIAIEAPDGLDIHIEDLK